MLSIKQSASRRARASSRLLVLVAAVMAMVAATMAPAAATPRVGGVTTAPQLKAQAADTSGAANYAVEVSNQVALAVLPPIDLYTTAGTVTIGGQTIPVWGYDTAPGPKNAAGGPTIEVTEGDIVTVTLHNNLNQPSALLFGGQSMIPDTEGAASGGVKTYVFTADKPGTYLYQAGLVPNHQHQVAMGLYGALIVKPAGAVSVTGTSTAADVTYADAVLADTPASYYRLGEAVGPTAADETATSPGTYGATAALGQAGLVSNSADTAVGFDGATVSDFVDTNVIVLPAATFSVEAWVNPASVGSGQRIISKDEVGVTGAWILWINAGQLRFQVRNSSNTAWVIAEAPTAPTVGTPIHVVGVFDGTNVILYVDGVAVDSIPLGTAAANTNALPITIGADSDAATRDHIFDGTIDEVALYGSALTQPQIQAHFDAATQPVGLTLTDLGAGFTAALVSQTLTNVTDGSSCTIATTTPDTLTCSARLSGGLTNTWANGDGYSVADAATAYGTPETAYDDEAVLVISEIDPSLNNTNPPAGFDMREFKPTYFLVNGEAFPDTTNIATSAGNRVLLRYVNAGSQYHSMALLGTHQSVVAFDGSPLNYARNFVAETFGPGQTADAIATIPAGTVDGTKFPIYDGSLLLHNSSDAGFGGMLTFLEISGAVGGTDTTGPLASNIVFVPGNLTATIDDSGTGGSNIAQAEAFIDTVGAEGTGIPMTAVDGFFDSVNEDVMSATSIGAGPHTIYVRGMDSELNWGPLNSIQINGGDIDGPLTTGSTVNPNPTNGSADVTLSATGDDTTTGGSNISQAEYFIGTAGANGSGVPMTVNNAAPIASLDAVIPAATVDALTPDGPHTISIHSMDSAGNWGPLVTIDFIVDKVGPVASAVTVSPNPNNGALPFSGSVAAVRVRAQLDDVSVGSNIVAVEGFLGTTPGTTGSGFVFVASDGLFNSSSEPAFADVPLTTIVQLPVGSHTFHVHGQDAAGNWGPFATGTLVIETDAPTVTGTTVTPPTALDDGTTPVALAATATDPSGSDIDLAEWFDGADPGVGNGTAMTVTGPGPSWTLADTIDTTGWALGPHTISVRARDAAGTWSATESTTLTVDPGTPPPASTMYFSTVGSGNTNPVPGVAAPFDDADVYFVDLIGPTFSRVLDGSALGLPGNADIDGLAFDGGVYYVSFLRNGGTNVPNAGGGTFVAQDEDVVIYDPDNGEWELFFSGSECLLDVGNGQDIDALDVVGGNLYFSTVGNSAVSGAAGPNDDADIYMWDGVGCSRVFDARVGTTGLAGHADIDGLTVIDATHFYVSFNRNGGTNGTGLGSVPDEDVVEFNLNTWTLYFDGSAEGNMGATNGRDLDAIDIP